MFPTKRDSHRHAEQVRAVLVLLGAFGEYAENDPQLVAGALKAIPLEHLERLASGLAELAFKLSNQISLREQADNDPTDQPEN